ncbi:MAG: putative Ig domain-containing protein [Muribaculaceae bacterium]|nr:putative Ig domain-containing protein [Muribaculaceae bacterium]
MLWLAGAALSASAQSKSFLVAKFKAGDDTARKEAGYNDKDWQTLKVTDVWDRQGVPASTDYGWYRFHFDAAPASEADRQKTEGDNYLYVNLGPVDDVDETYLNGTLIGKTGRFPTDEGGYASMWNTPRKYLADKKLLNRGGDNVLAVRVYSGGEPGGIFRGPVTVSTPRNLDGTALTFSEKESKGTSKCVITLSNEFPWTVKGVLEIKEADLETGKVGKTIRRNISARPGKNAEIALPYNIKSPVKMLVTFTDSKSGEMLKKAYTPKYILTPPAPAAPRFNTAPVYGVRPGSPVHFRFGVSGDRPMTFSSADLPEGLTLGADNGVLSGSIGDYGDYIFTVKATNAKGSAEQTFTLKVGDAIALTPPMGWNSWNCWGLSVSQDRVMSSANALVDKGLADYGYCYMNIDDGWEAPYRNDDGTIAVNEKFPDMKALGDWLHERGLKFGIYSSPGDLTCGGYLGSLDHELQDAESYNSWGVDYLKYDWCGYWRKHATQKDRNTLASYIRPYMLMGEYLRQQPRDIFYSLCQYGMADVWKWGHTVDANSWRTTGDIEDTWQSLYSIGFEQQLDLAPYAEPGRWNDPDMMIVGKVGWSDNLRDSRLTPDEQYTHVSLWALLAANMLIGCDLAQLDDFTVSLLCNNEVNAVNQDILGKQATCVVSDGDLRIWARPLADGSTAVGIFNVGDDDITVNLADYLPRLGLKSLKTNRDLWRQKDLSTTDLVYPVSTHAVRFLKVS